MNTCFISYTETTNSSFIDSENLLKELTWEGVYYSYHEFYVYKTIVAEKINGKLIYFLLIRPSKKCLKTEFESLFGFGPSCKGYTKYRIKKIEIKIKFNEIKIINFKS